MLPMSHRFILDIEFKKAVPKELVEKDPESAFQPIGIRKSCFKHGHNVIYNSGKLQGLTER